MDEAAKYAKVHLGRQHENDVLARYYEAAKESEADIIMRITGDCPLISPELCGAVLLPVAAELADYASNIYPHRTFPKGCDCEAFTMKTLERAHEEATEAYDREHVTPWMQRNVPLVDIGMIRSPWPIEGRLCIDTEDDYKVICAHFGHAPYETKVAA